MRVKKVSMRKGFKMFGETFIVTDFAGYSESTLRIFHPQYTITHYKTGANVLHSESKEKISNFIDRAKRFLSNKEKLLKTVLTNLEVINWD